MRLNTIVVLVLLGLLPIQTSFVDRQLNISEDPAETVFDGHGHAHHSHLSLLSESLMPVESYDLFTTQESLPAGTWIIAMDNTLQGGGTFNIRAYGLAVHLLHADIPLKWIINPSKGKDAIDFTAAASRVLPTVQASSSRNFKAGPLAIFPGFEDEAQAVINAFNNGTNDVSVYELTNAATVDVYATLTHKPKAAVLIDGNPDPTIHSDILDDAGLIMGTHYDNDVSAADLTANSCYTVATEPHVEFSAAQAATFVPMVRTFVQNGGNFLAQCAAGRSYQSHPEAMFVGAGFVDEAGISDPFGYDNHDEPFAQFEGSLENEGGSLEDFGFTTDPTGGTRIVYDPTDTDQYKAYVGRLTGVTKPNGGYVHYLGGHNYDGNTQPIINGKRMLLNAILRPASRPDECMLVIGPDAENDEGTLANCGQSSVTVNVVANDTDPLGNGLTVSLMGTGSYGTFTNNGNGTVTYTPNPGAWLGPDIITYQVCDSENTCDQAQITISGETDNKINGTVFLDSDGDGVLDGGEPGQSGVDVFLYEDNSPMDGSPDGAAISTTTTDGSGEYAFYLTPDFDEAFVYNQRIGASADDATQDNGSMKLADPEIKFAKSDGKKIGGLRFQGVNIPAGATITSAFMYWDHGEDKSKTSSVQIYGQDDSANPPAFSNTNNNITDRSTTSASVKYDISWSGNETNQQTPDLKSIIQEVVDKNSGANSLVFILGTNADSDDEIKIVSWDDNPSASARLVVNYTAITGGPYHYVIQIDENTLPTGATMTTDNAELVTFTGPGQLDCDNDFGFFPAIIVEAIQPMCNHQSGKIEVTAPLDADYEYKLNSGAYQDSPIFNDVDDGTYTVTLRVKSTGYELTSDPVTIENVVCAENDINQTPMDMPVEGHILTNDGDGQSYGLEVASATYLNASGVSTSLSFNTATTIYDASGTMAGTIVLQQDGNYLYTPATGYTGFVPVDYVLKDDQTSTSRDPATLMIEVFGSGAGNNPPIAQDDTNTTEAGVPASANVIIPNDTDPDGDALTVISALVDTDSDRIPDASLTIGGPAITISGIDDDGNPVANAGTISLAANGDYVFTPNNDIDGSGTPFTGKVCANYTISDGNGGTDSATLTILVIDAGDNQTFANDDANLGPQGQPQTGSIMTNDWDPELDTQTIGMIDSDGDGMMDTPVSGGGTYTITHNSTTIGTLTIDETDGSYTWTPMSNFVGTAVIPYSTCDDGSPGTACDEATLYLTTFGVPDLTPTISVAPTTGISGPKPMRVIVNIKEVFGTPTEGQVIVTIPKVSQLSFTYDPNATSSGGIGVSNSDWDFSEGFSAWIFTSKPGVVISGFSNSQFGFVGTFDAAFTNGNLNFTVNIINGTGSETIFTNNTDYEKIYYEQQSID